MIDYRKNAFEMSKGYPDLRMYLIRSIGAAASYGQTQCDLYVEQKDKEKATELLDDWGFEFDVNCDSIWIYWGEN